MLLIRECMRHVIVFLLLCFFSFNNLTKIINVLYVFIYLQLLTFFIQLSITRYSVLGIVFLKQEKLFQHSKLY